MGPSNSHLFSFLRRGYLVGAYLPDFTVYKMYSMLTECSSTEILTSQGVLEVVVVSLTATVSELGAELGEGIEPVSLLERGTRPQLLRLRTYSL